MARHLIGTEDWTDSRFTNAKSFVCSVFSECVYHHVPNLEVGDKRRIHLVPCAAYRRIALSAGSSDVRSLLQEGEFQSVSIYTTAYAVFLQIRTPSVIFVAVRGTLPLFERGYDLLIDFNVWQTEHLLRFGAARFHAGFYHEAHQYFAHLWQSIASYNYTKIPPIYVTGHSLGGAMAAIIHALWSYPAVAHTPAMATHSSYVFGMPRYGDKRAVSHFRSPYHTMRSGDPIPKTPLAPWYANCPNEYEPSGTMIDQRALLQQWPLLHVLTEPIALFRQHSIERYRHDISRSI